jgi:GNAT superfamily N-acetyltransferase
MTQHRVVRLGDPSELASVESIQGWPRLTRTDIAQHAPSLSMMAVDRGRVLARCSLWLDGVPSYEQHRVGAIGHYAARDREASADLLDAASAELARRGCTLAIGPMDGTTWRRYRLVVERGTEPPFFLEPDNPDDWPGYFADAGFSPIARYLSALNEDLGRQDPRADEVAERLASGGVAIRPLDMTSFDEELVRIHQVASIAFRDAFLFTPLSQDAFAEQYRAIRPFIRPELVLVAERQGEPVGFSFSVPDALEPARGAPSRTVVVKTLAILPDRSRLSGLGSLMADRTRDVARSLGYTRAVHALIHESNHSRAISERTGRRIRRYALFARSLDG